MTPTEFIGRCMDAANRALRDQLTVPISTQSFLVAGLTLNALPTPLSFDLNQYHFTLEITQMHEMLQFTAVMVDSENNDCWEATMVLSKLNNSIISHWISDEPKCGRVDEFTLFRLMTDNRFPIYASIQ